MQKYCNKVQSISASQIIGKQLATTQHFTLLLPGSIDSFMHLRVKITVHQSTLWEVYSICVTLSVVHTHLQQPDVARGQSWDPKKHFGALCDRRCVQSGMI